MNRGIEIEVFPSQYPDALAEARWRSLERRVVDCRLHYEGYRQARKWIALTQAFAPVYQDARCASLYDTMYRKSAQLLRGAPMELVALGCGHADKEKELMTVLDRENCSVQRLTLCDCGLEMLVSARLNLQGVSPIGARAVAVDILNAAETRSAVATSHRTGESRVVTCFGVTPNADPSRLATSLRESARPGDIVLVSANLAPFESASERSNVLQGYDNDLTRDWLSGFLDDVGIDRASGAFEFVWELEDSLVGRARIGCDWVFRRSIEVKTPRESALRFEDGDRLRLFYSYRYTLSAFEKWLTEEGFVISELMASDAHDEALALVRASA